MAADLSRIRFDALRDYAGVDLQQGRVLLDADFNELGAIVDRRFRAATSDILGRSTVSSTTPDAFKITIAAGSLQIGKGRLYVDGLLAENHGAVSDDPAKKLFDPLLSEVTYADPIGYATQPYLPGAPALPTAGTHLVYLDVWERAVTHVEDPSLVEIAVGVDTTSRMQTVWQVRVHAPDAGRASCGSPDDDIEGWPLLIAPSSGRLTTGTFEVPPEDDPCELPPTGGYRGLENQTYRVEIHDPGQAGAGATFKWSRESASVCARIVTVHSGTELELASLGRDDVLRFNTGDWVEIVDEVRELSQRCGEVRQITVDEASRRISFADTLPGEMLPAGFPDADFPRSRRMRVVRWDQKHKVLAAGTGGSTSVFQDLDAGTTGVIDVPPAGTALLLENGVTVSFDSVGAKGFRAGDYWVFAARTADASVELLVREPPRGIHHHYERVALWNVDAGTVTDCRHPWPPSGGGEAAHDCGCTACVTAASHASGQFTIQDAVNQVQATGGTVCLGAGQYALRAPVQVSNARSLRIRGQGPATVLVAPGTAFIVESSVAIAIEKLALVSQGANAAIDIRTVLGLALQELAVLVIANPNAAGIAISLRGVVAGALIENNAIVAPVGIFAAEPIAGDPDGTVPPPVSFLLAAALAIQDNLMSCQRAAVSLEGNVLHLLGTRIAGNEVLGCTDTAISALGLGAPGSALRVCGNTLNVPGNGIRCGVDGLWIEDNKLHNTAARATPAGAAATATIGIALAVGLDKSGADQCQILANQIRGFTAAGISIGSPVRDLIVKLNIIEDCNNGIVCTDEADSGSVSIENNKLRDIGAAIPEGSVLPVIGIGVTRAVSATIAGNTLRTLAPKALESALRVAILTIGVLRPQVSGNDLADIGPPGEFARTCAGIMLRAPLTEFHVGHNQVRRDNAPSAQTSNSVWLALVIGEVASAGAASGVAGPTTVQLDGGRTLVLGAGTPFVTALGADTTAEAAAVQIVRGSVLGNVLSGRGAPTVVQVAANGECVFGDNRIESRSNNNAAAVLLTTAAAIVSANRIRGGKPSMDIAGVANAAVLGNITSGGIGVAGGLGPPWNALNLIG